MSKTKRVPVVLNNYEQAALLGQPNPKVPTGLRNLCILSLMLNTGLRVNEVIGSKNDDIDWEEGYINIKGSGAAEARILWLAQAESSLLRRWRAIKPSASDLLFCTLEGNRLKDRYIREMVKRLALKAGITKDIYPHVLRYTFAFNLMRETGDIELLQKALGHRDLSTTKQYVSFFFHDIIEQTGEMSKRRSGIPVEVKPVETKDVDVGTAESDHSIKGKPAFSTPVTATTKSSNKEGEGRETTDSNAETSMKTDAYGIAHRKPCAESKVESAGHNATISAAKQDLRPSGATPDQKNQWELKGRNDQSAAKGYKKHRADPDVSAGETGGHTGEIKKVPIPALKCSCCDYILRYQGDCPKCGAKFNDILRHWGKNV